MGPSKSLARSLVLWLFMFVGSTTLLSTALGINITIPELTGRSGTNVTVPINIGDTTSLGIIGVEVNLEYDSNILTANDVSIEDTVVSSSGWGSPTYNIAEGRIIIWMAHHAPLAGVGVLLRVNFTVSDAAGNGDATLLTLSDVSLNEGSVPVATTDGSFTVHMDTSTFNIPLEPSWNLISIPVELANTALADVLQSINGLYDAVWAYNAATDTWSRYVVDGIPWLNDLDAIIPSKGYWLQMSAAATLILDGAPVEGPIALWANWNLVGYNYLIELSRDDALASIASECIAVWGYDATDDSWERYVPDGLSWLNDLETFKPARGYWIDSAGVCSWNVSGGMAAPPVAAGFRRSRVSSPRPEIPYTIWGTVEADGVKVADGTVVLKMGDRVQSSYKLGSRVGYGDHYALDIPATVDGSNQATLYVQANNTEIRVATVPPGTAGQIIRLDLSAQLPPEVSTLHQNYPNPFNPETWIPYQLKEETQVEIRIYTATGQLARTLNLGHKPAGFYTDKAKAAYWDGKNEAGERAASGVYFYSIKTGDLNSTRKLVVTR